MQAGGQSVEAVRVIRVAIVEDNTLLAKALVRRLGLEPDFQVGCVLESAEGLSETVRNQSIDLVIIDLSLSGVSSMDAIQTLTAECPACKAVVFSGRTDEDTVEEAFRAGAWGYVFKHDDPKALIDALRRVHAGEVVMPSV
ncbi:MAG TPA: response regulator transcription factor [Phycisphaerales bacterium]|nr:response regulator transcription factor [Phycisphaerales bacterium]